MWCQHAHQYVDGAEALQLLDADLHAVLTALKVQPRVMAVLVDAGATESDTFSMMASSGPGMRDWVIKDLGLDEGV